MIGKTFGFTNGIITILALITGLHATKVNKIGIIGAILALLITDPLSDAFSLYTSHKLIDKKKAFNVGLNAFLSQVFLQLLFLIIIIISPNVETALYICYIIGFILTILYDFYNNIKCKETIKKIFIIFTLVLLTYFIDIFVYKYFN